MGWLAMALVAGVLALLAGPKGAGADEMGANSALASGTPAGLGVAGPLAVTPSGTLLVADVAGDRVLARLPDGRFQVVAGNGTVGFSGDGGPAIDAELSAVSDLAVGPDGTLYVADGSRVRAVTTDGTIRTVVGRGGPRQPVASGTPALSASLGSPLFLAIGPDGTLYVSNQAQILRESPDGTLDTIGTVMASGPLAGRPASLGPIAVDQQGTLYGSGCVGWSICQVEAGGVVNLGYARRTGGNLSMLQRGPDGAVYGADGPTVVRVQDGQLVPVAALPYPFLDYFTIGPDGTVYADELPGGKGFEALQQLISYQSGQVELLWQESNLTVPAPSFDPACAVSSGDGEVGPGRAPPVSVAGRPSRVIGDWLPGPNVHPCSVKVVQGGAGLARRLARDIDRAPLLEATFSYHCPMDTQEGVRLLFFMAHRRTASAVLGADITGCGTVGPLDPATGGLRPRQLTPAIRADLAALDPPAWAVPWIR